MKKVCANIRSPELHRLGFSIFNYGNCSRICASCQTVLRGGYFYGLSIYRCCQNQIKLNGLTGIRRHHQERDRVKSNPNIDLTRSHLNYCIENLTPENLNSRVKARIKQLNLKKRPRSDAVGIMDTVVSASPDFMLNIDAEIRENYFADALHFLQKRYGKENVMYCQCHMDESSPHIHVGIIPITSDGRLSAKSLFSPKTLEQLQTDFHRDVSSRYGLERGESHSKKYLPIQKFKAQQAKIKAAHFTEDLHIAEINQRKIEQANKSAHYVATGIIFTSEDKENVQLPTDNFIELRKIAEQGLKAVAQIDLLKDELQKIRHDEAQARSDLSFFLHELNKLEKDTANYSAIPKLWRSHIDDSIDFWKKNFTNYCHDVNRSTAKVFLATHFNFDKTERLMYEHIKKTGVKNVRQHIKNVVLAAQLQFKKNSQPTGCSPSWKPPKPSDTDYKKSDDTGLVLPPTPAQLGGDDINWDMFNWNLLSELDKDKLIFKEMVRNL